VLYKTEAIPVQAEGFAETTHFDIPATGKAFKSLIDNIYSRKIEAPIRELCTNAFDAHLEAGIEEPFRLKLPTKFDPMFMVRDYGLGMTHQFIMGDFKSLFKSTKDHTNKVVGMKGLGSKSPFAYTDAFILRVFSGQTVRTYSTYIGEDGIPQLAYQGEGPSDERRGVAVQFPVQTKDIDDFYAAAIRVLKGFPVLPEGLPKTVTDGLSGSDLVAVEVGSFWKAYPKGWLGMGAFARQGCVIYPIDLDKIEDGAWLKTLDLSVVIEFPIGTVQMVDSREFLAYDEETVANINDACSRIKNDIDEKIKRVMSSARTIWDVRHLFKSDMFDGLGPLARGSRQYAAITALNTFMKECLPKRKSERGTAKQLFYSIVRLKKKAGDGNFPDEVRIAYTRNDDGYNEKSLDEPVFVYLGKDPKLRRNCKVRAKIYLQQHPAITGVVFLEDLSLHLHRQLGKPKVMRVADLPVPPVKPRGAHTPHEWERFQEFGQSQFAIKEVDEEDLSETKAVYMFINKGQPFLVTPEYTLKQFTRTELYSVDKLMRMLLRQRLIFINVRMNEKLTRWPAKDFPRYRDDVLTGAVAKLSRARIVPLISIINHERFEGTVYDRALGEIGRLRIMKQKRKRYTNPLFDLVRFNDRYAATTKEQQRLISAMSKEMKEELIQRAIGLKLEVLPEPVHVIRGANNFPYPLLPAKWEKIAAYLGGYNNDAEKDILIDIIKEFGKSC
jgi:hypothetical protein